MSFTSWLRNLRSALAPSPVACRHRRQRSLRATTHRPGLEVLEDRWLPSTFTVLNLNDSGPDSLRAAIAAANANPGADAIDIATTGTIALTSGQLDITDSVTINGPGASALTVSGEWLSRVFAITGDPTVTIAGLTVANGWTVGSPGGGIAMAGGTLTLANCTVTGNTAVGDPYFLSSAHPGMGGALYVAGGTLTLDHVTVSWNSAVGAYGGFGAGGGVYVASGIVSINQSTVYGNVAGGAGGRSGSMGGGDGGQGAGGGVAIAGGMVHVNRSTVSGNGAYGGAGGGAYGSGDFFYGGSGGAATGGGIGVAGGTLQLRQSIISDNGAYGGDPGDSASGADFSGAPGVSYGGGLYIATAEPPIADLDTFTLSNTINNFADYYPNIAGPYFLDGMPRLSIGDATVLEGNEGTTALVFTVTRSGPIGQAVSVDYTTAGGPATSASDYAPACGTLTIPANETKGTITVWVNGDRLGEPNETFVVNLSSPTNATIADGQGIGTIVDDEPRISISNVSKAEGKNRKTTLFTFTVTLSTVYDQAVTMSFATVNGTATTSDNDYVAKTGTLTFAPYETTKTITIEVKGDSKKEANETFYLDLSGVSSNALFTKNRGLGTILNDD